MQTLCPLFLYVTQIRLQIVAIFVSPLIVGNNRYGSFNASRHRATNPARCEYKSQKPLNVTTAESVFRGLVGHGRVFVLGADIACNASIPASVFRAFETLRSCQWKPASRSCTNTAFASEGSILKKNIFFDNNLTQPELKQRNLNLNQTNVT